MRKSLLLTATLLFSIFSFAEEYINDKYCVYRIDVERQTAWVVNFCSEATSITIPASFTYLGDKYTVERIERPNDFKKNYDSKYCYYDYKSIRSKIIELNLPRTLKKLGLFALEDMTRLKSITIPSSVSVFNANIFSGNSRLETIIIEGLPCCEYSKWNEWKTHSFCLNEVLDPVASLDSMVAALKELNCPKLQAIEVLPLKDYLFYQSKLNKAYEAYSKQLHDTIFVYKRELARHPYYLENYYFNKIILSKPVLSTTKVKENYATQSSSLSKEYNRLLNLCREEFQSNWDNMEQNCKQKSPNTYATRYCENNPEFSAQIDTLFKDYKCWSKEGLVLAVLDKNQLGEKCQDKLWRQYSYLYKDKEMFLATYDKSSNIMQEIATCKSFYDGLKNTINYYKISIKGFYDSDYIPSIKARFVQYYESMKDHGTPVSISIIEEDPKALKEFEKNGKYFDSPDEFFAAYITSKYNNILKEKKKAKK